MDNEKSIQEVLPKINRQNGEFFISFSKDMDTVILDGEFTIGDLEQILDLMIYDSK
jgi:hypothetical protein